MSHSSSSGMCDNGRKPGHCISPPDMSHLPVVGCSAGQLVDSSTSCSGSRECEGPIIYPGYHVEYHVTQVFKLAIEVFLFHYPVSAGLIDVITLCGIFMFVVLIGAM